MTEREAAELVASILATYAARWYTVDSHAPVVERHHRDTADAILSALVAAGWQSPAEHKAAIAGAVRDVVALATDPDRIVEWAALVRAVADGDYTATTQPPVSLGVEVSAPTSVVANNPPEELQTMTEATVRARVAADLRAALVPGALPPWAEPGRPWPPVAQSVAEWAARIAEGTLRRWTGELTDATPPEEPQP